MSSRPKIVSGCTSERPASSWSAVPCCGLGYAGVLRHARVEGPRESGARAGGEGFGLAERRFRTGAPGFGQWVGTFAGLGSCVAAKAVPKGMIGTWPPDEHS